jgi:hypothetical protein
MNSHQHITANKTTIPATAAEDNRINDRQDSSSQGASLVTRTQPGSGSHAARPAEDSPAAIEPNYRSQLDINPVQIHIERGWTAVKDREFFDSIWALDMAAGEDPYQFMVAKIGQNLDALANTLDQAVRFLSVGELDADALDLLSIADKVVLLRKLFVEHVQQVPAGHQRNYLFRFNEHLDQCQQVLALHGTVFFKFLLNRGNTWLSELVHLADWIATAQLEFEEGMDCEHDGFRSWRKSLPAG